MAIEREREREREKEGERERERERGREKEGGREGEGYCRQEGTNKKQVYPENVQLAISIVIIFRFDFRAAPFLSPYF